MCQVAAPTGADLCGVDPMTTCHTLVRDVIADGRSVFFMEVG